MKNFLVDVHKKIPSIEPKFDKREIEEEVGFVPPVKLILLLLLPLQEFYLHI